MFTFTVSKGCPTKTPAAPRGCNNNKKRGKEIQLQNLSSTLQ